MSAYHDRNVVMVYYGRALREVHVRVCLMPLRAVIDVYLVPDTVYLA